MCGPLRDPLRFEVVDHHKTSQGGFTQRRKDHAKTQRRCKQTLRRILIFAPLRETGFEGLMPRRGEAVAHKKTRISTIDRRDPQIDLAVVIQRLRPLEDDPLSIR